MTTTNTMVAKIAAAVAGFGLVLSAFAPMASAQTNDQAAMEAQIAALMAQIAALQAQTGGSSSASMTFTRDLTIGSSGADVTALQNWLIKGGYAIPAGATGYFGAQTAAALAKYQAANNITPAAGYFGPITRAKVNASAGGSTGGNTGGNDDDDDDSDNDDLSGGEASLENLDIRDGEDDDVEEDSTAQIAEIEFDVEDGDVRIDRVDLRFEAEAGAGEDEPWEVFQTITLYDADGDELASEDVSDEDDWLDEDDGDFRFTGLDYVVREGDMATIIVEVETQGNVLDDASDTWTLTVVDEAIRGVDSEGIQQYLDENDSIEFDVVEEGADDELDVSSSSEDPDSSVLQVEDNGRSDEYTIFAFEIEADEDGSDVELDTVAIEIIVTGAASTSQVINDLVLSIDGEEFDDWEYGNGTTGATSTATVIFDIDGDFTVDAGDVVTAELMAEFKAVVAGSSSSAFTSGDTVRARIISGAIAGEGADDLVSSGSASGEAHTLREDIFEISEVDSSASRNEAGDVGTFSFDFTIEATDGDVVLATSDVVSTVIGTTTGNTVTKVLSRVSGDATESPSGTFTIEDGDSATFSYDVTVTVSSTTGNGSYRVNVDTIEGVDVDETSPALLLADAP